MNVGQNCHTSLLISMRTNKNKYPLRKVIQRNLTGDYKGIHFNRLHLLECGHMVPPSRDMYGELNSERQRCRLCFEKLKEDKKI